MITQIRGQFKGVAYKYSLWALIGAFILVYIDIPSLFKSVKNDSWALRVNNELVSYKVFVQEVDQKRSLIEALRMQYGQYADMLLEAYGLSNDPKTIAYHNVVRNELLRQKTNAMGILLGQSYVSEMANNQQFLRGEFGDVIAGTIFHSNKGDVNALCNVLKHFGLTAEDFEKKIEEGAQRAWLADLLTTSMLVPMYDVTQQYVTQHLAKKYGVLSISHDAAKKEVGKKTITPEEMRDFFKQQNLLSQKYWVGEQRTGIAWRLTADAYNITVTDEQISDYYKQHAHTKYVESPAAIKIRKIVFLVNGNKESKLHDAQKIHAQLISNPETFADVAKQVSEDPLTKADGGLMPFFKKGEKERVVEQAGFLLSQPGDISNVIETNMGFEIIQLVEKKDKLLKPLSKVSALIKNELTTVAFKKLFSQDLSGMNDLGALETLMRDKKVMPIDVVSVSINSDNAMAKKLFQLRSIGAIGSYIDGSTGVVVCLKAIEKPFEQPFDQVMEQVRGDLLNDLADKKLEEYRATISTMLSHGNDLKQIGASLGIAAYQETDFLSPNNRKDMDAILAGKARYTIMAALEKQGSVAQEIGQNGLVAAQVIAVEPINEDQYNKAIDGVENELLGARSRLVLEGFVASLYKNAKIETNEAVFLRC